MDQAVASWKDAVKADPTLGGEKLEATIVDVDAGLRAFATQDFTALMEATGLRHHPETVKTFAKLGAMLREGKVLTGTAAKQPEKSLAELLYPTSA